MTGFLAWLLRPVAPPVAVHLSLAATLFPLILAVMIHLAPVLTRTAPARGWVGYAPFAALAGGGVAVLTLLGALPWFALHLAALLGMGAGGAVLVWMTQRARTALAGSHPGLIWYQAALTLLLLALPAMPIGLFWPEAWPALRLFHLHLNLLGFIGLTAVGTLQVLLPTAAARPDPGAGVRLRQGWRHAVIGTLLVALGAAWWPPLAGVGALAWLWVMGGFLRAVVNAGLYRAPGPARALTLAAFGFGVLLLTGAAHGLGALPQAPMLPLLATLFLFPLVTGAFSHFLPLWRYPGAPGEQQRQLRQALARALEMRLGLFVVGSALVWWRAEWGLAVAAAGVALTLLQAARAIRDVRGEPG